MFRKIFFDLLKTRFFDVCSGYRVVQNGFRKIKANAFSSNLDIHKSHNSPRGTKLSISNTVFASTSTLSFQIRDCMHYHSLVFFISKGL